MSEEELNWSDLSREINHLLDSVDEADISSFSEHQTSSEAISTPNSILSRDEESIPAPIPKTLNLNPDEHFISDNSQSSQISHMSTTTSTNPWLGADPLKTK